MICGEPLLAIWGSARLAALDKTAKLVGENGVLVDTSDMHVAFFRPHPVIRWDYRGPAMLSEYFSKRFWIVTSKRNLAEEPSELDPHGTSLARSLSAVAGKGT